MSLKYLFFRLSYALQIKSGLLKKRFPVKEKSLHIISREEWIQSTSGAFFFSSRDEVGITEKDNSSEDVHERLSEMENNTFRFFSELRVDVGSKINWHKNYISGYEYPKEQHWSNVNDFSEKNGDIKYVWELSRFCFLYDFIRYDQYTGADHSQTVFAYIEDWITENPLNQGPNYKCSQEMSLRLFNWTFALYYYRKSSSLTPSLFNKISSSIYNQYLHVCENINFSRIAVRNNHAITETMAVWLIPHLFPFFPKTDSNVRKGKKWFEEEINYQIFDDGTYLQYSHNYHRVVIQLLTWGIVLGKKNNDQLSDESIEKAKKSLEFLIACQDKSGCLPNYGSNDGALFFPLSSTDYPDFSSQLQAFGAALGYKLYQSDYEDLVWYGIDACGFESLDSFLGVKCFKSEGYALIREEDTLTSLPCCKNTKRPFQADSLHLDIFYKGINVLLDAGSYLYNASNGELEQFVGTAAHNTISINGKSQMERVGRFVWKDWSKSKFIDSSETDTSYVFTARVNGFQAVRKGITHTRRVIKYKLKPVWKIIDSLEGTHDTDEIKINWLFDASMEKNVDIRTQTSKGDQLTYERKVRSYSRYYAKKQDARSLSTITSDSHIETIITIK